MSISASPEASLNGAAAVRGRAGASPLARDLYWFAVSRPAAWRVYDLTVALLSAYAAVSAAFRLFPDGLTDKHAHPFTIILGYGLLYPLLGLACGVYERPCFAKWYRPTIRIAL